MRSVISDRIRAPHPDRKVSLDEFLFECERRSVEREEIKRNGDCIEEKFCYCLELIVNGKRLPCSKYHDCSYVSQRSALVPEADRIAARAIKGRCGRIAQSKYVRVFAATMERLVKDAGLLNGSSVELK